MEETKPKHPGGRPLTYTSDMITKTEEYLSQCVDEVENYHKTRGKRSDSYERIVNVRLPTIEGLAVHLGISRDTVYDWEKNYEGFSDILAILRATQADALINNGLSGNYNPTIAKVLLTKHGYREGIDQTTNDKDIPTPIMDVNKLKQE